MTTLIVNAQIFPKSNHYYTLYSQALRSILALQWLVFRRDGSIIISVGHVFFLPLSWVWHVPCNALSGWQNAQCALKIEKKCNLNSSSSFLPNFRHMWRFFKDHLSPYSTKKIHILSPSCLFCTFFPISLHTVCFTQSRVVQ